MKQCKQCGSEFEPKRTTAVYCSARCKQSAYRNTDVTVTPVTVTDVTVTDELGVTVTGSRDPLDMYSPERWARMQAKGYEMPGEYDGQLTLEGRTPVAVELGYARRLVGPGQYNFLVPVPGDPAYDWGESAVPDADTMPSVVGAGSAAEQELR